MESGRKLVLRKHLHRKEPYQLEHMGKASKHQSNSQTHLVLPAPKETKIFKTPSPPTSKERVVGLLHALYADDRVSHVFLSIS